jgi:DNA-directed RNA polymerase II subunit RPB2
MILNTLYDEKRNRYGRLCHFYFGGKDGTRIYYGKPIIRDSSRALVVTAVTATETAAATESVDGEEKHYMYPNEARLKNMTYSMTIHYDVDIEYFTNDGVDSDDPPHMEGGETISKVYLGKFPIMVQSDFCILNGMPRSARFALGECRNDMGGYFIISGKEKVLITQEKFADNMLYVEAIKPSEDAKELFVAKIRSVSENVSKPVRTLAVKMMAPSKTYTNRHIVVSIPNVSRPVPLFIVFRALGILSDKEIIQFCLVDLDKYEALMDLFVPSVHDASAVMSQTQALDFVAQLLTTRCS